MVPVPWPAEATYALPVEMWKDVMDSHFPGSAWLRVRRDTLDALQRWKCENDITSWDVAIETLIASST